jgi:hypothetical protein
VAAPPVYPYLGNDTRVYSQYMDVTGDAQGTLTAEPGGEYAIAPAPGYEGKKGASTLSVPPADGRWGDPVKASSNNTVAAKKGASE